jgi:hypothetical protein
VLIYAQACPDCALKSTLLVFSSSATDTRLVKQQSTLDEAADDMMDRFVLRIPVIPKPTHYQPPVDTPHALLLPKKSLRSAPGSRSRKVNSASYCSAKTAPSRFAAQLL